jgi:hypothetical protein
MVVAEFLRDSLRPDRPSLTAKSARSTSGFVPTIIQPVA